MRYISSEELDNIRDNADIVEIIGDYISLVKKGNNYLGVCPFHNDTKPSLTVSPSKRIFHCFACNPPVGGNVFTFVQKIENCSFTEAVKIVAEKSGVNFNYDDNNVGSKYQKEYDIMNLSLKYYQNYLQTKNGLKAKEYLYNRGITDEIIKEFKIGLAPGNNELRKFFEDKNINLNEAEALSLFSKNGTQFYDFFNTRIMIPIFDTNGKLVAYTGRIYENIDQSKYMNSRETKIYVKSNIIFNYHNAKNYVRQSGKIIIVEGNMDAISMAHNGIKNVVALMGVNISDFQIKALKKLNSQIVLMLDSDKAGIAATLNYGDRLKNEGLNVLVVKLDGAKDPDEYIQKYGVEKLNRAIDNAQNYLDFKLETIKEDKNLENPQELVDYINEVLKAIENYSVQEQDIIISVICKKYNLEPSVIKQNIKQKNEVTKPVIVKNEIPKIKMSRYQKAFQELIMAILNNENYYYTFMESNIVLLNKAERDTIRLLGGYLSKHKTLDLAGIIDEALEYEEVSKLIQSIFINNLEQSIDEKEFCDILVTIKKLIRDEEINKIKEQIKQSKFDEEKEALIIRLIELKKGDGEDERN